jgi:hypothetical protein
MEVGMRTQVAKFAPVLAALAACATYPAPTEHLASSVAAVRGAQEVGASASPQAALHLRLAQEEVAKAKALMDQGNNERADSMTMRATADAELALALAREETARARTEESAAKVQSQSPRTTEGPSQ